MRIAALLALGISGLVAVSSAPAEPRADLRDAIRAGIVGERFDGYLGYAAEPSDSVKRQVAAVNIRRRALYLGIAAKRGVSPRYAAIAAGCELLASVDVGQSYLLKDGEWRRRAAGQPSPAPSYCAR